MALKHVMICHDSSQRVRAAELEELCTNNNFRSYFGSDQGDLNNAIAVGVENAALFVCLPSKDFQDSQYCMKAVCYADQCKVPFLCIDNEGDNWKPSSWLGAVLAAVKHCTKSDFINTITSLCDPGKIIGMSQSTGNSVVGPTSNDIFTGGKVQGYYFDSYLNHNADMVFDFFKLTNDSILGQGTDEVGMFTIHGEYVHKIDSKFDARFTKQYVGKHAVIYSGSITKGGSGEFTMEGMHNYGKLPSVVYFGSSMDSVPTITNVHLVW
jgi:hypothetical protein